ncbi:MAG TPA: hypothetical protein VGQ66_00735 [Candidatus Limnocylindria bacterium]|nr:hypothetical protein [Candidatus Limnocylindria bacterium]
MRTAHLMALALALTACSLLVRETAVPVTHTDPYPANPGGTWDAILTVVAVELGTQTEVSVAEALAGPRHGELILVRGALFADDAYGQVWLCSRAELSPDSGRVQCAGSILLLAGETEGSGLTASAYVASLLALADLGELQQTGTVRWSADAALLGRIR